MLLQGMEGGWVVIEASHTVTSGLNVTYMLNGYISPTSTVITMVTSPEGAVQDYHKNTCDSY